MSDKRYAYPYAPINEGIGKGLLVYTGEPIELSEDESLPENSSKWKPTINVPGQVAYYNPLGFWVIAPDINKADPSIVRAAILRRITDDFNYEMTQLSAQYPIAEQQSWAQQLAEAQAFLADASATTPLLSKLATVRGVNVKDLAQKIVDKNTAYQSQYTDKLAAFQKQRSAIEMSDLPSVTLADLDYVLHV